MSTTQSMPEVVTALTPGEISRHVNNFWQYMEKNWSRLRQFLLHNNEATRERAMTRALNETNQALGVLQRHLDIEYTIGEANRIVFDQTANRVEMYISPRLDRRNIPYLEALYQTGEELIRTSEKLTGLNIYKYRAYKANGELLSSVEYPNGDVFNYSDFGCQINHGVSELGGKNVPVLHLVVWIKDTVAPKVVEKKKVRFVNPDIPNDPGTQLDRWLPSKSNVVDLLLLNMVGEWSIMHGIGYIEYMPEGMTDIDPKAEFRELLDIRKRMAFIHKGLRKCSVCGRFEYQVRKLFRCSTCKKTIYCSALCAEIDSVIHAQACLA